MPVCPQLSLKSSSVLETDHTNHTEPAKAARMIGLLTAWLVLLSATPLRAADERPLDRILNSIVLDAASPKRDGDRTVEIEPGGSIGQTFRTGSHVADVARIGIWQAFWHDSWAPDEKIRMTLWDSPEKKVSYGHFDIPYAQRMWEQALPMFLLEAQVEPDHEYYFEITVEVEPLRPAKPPREWLLTEKRPGISGGDRHVGGFGVAQEDYTDGRAYINGEPQDFDLFFEIHARRDVPRDQYYQRAFDRFDLDYPPLVEVKKAVEARDWDTAVTALVEHFEGRDDLIDETRRTPTYDPTFDTSWADWSCQQQVLLDDGTLVDLRPNWNHYALWPERGGVGLTRTGLRKPLSIAYEHTGNDKYAVAFNDLIVNFLIYCPPPLLAGVYPEEGEIRGALYAGIRGGTMWSALSIGARMLHGFHYYTSFIDSPYFTEDTRAAWIINLGQMASMLERMKGGGNWQTQMADALFNFGMRYPEFQRSPIWFEKGFSTLVDNALSTVRSDGVLQEPTINYHMLVLNRYSKALLRAREIDLDIPDEMRDLTEKMFDFVLFSTLPNGTLPAWGDSNPVTKPELLERGADLFDRPDYAYVFTGGKKGSPPKETSKAFPEGGFYYMRSGWQRDDSAMGIRCGWFGSHGHFDALSVVVNSLGRTVLIDPGVHTYGTEQSRELTATQSHNTMGIGEHSADHASMDRWATMGHLDYFAGHNHGYRERRDVQHHRRIAFVKIPDSTSHLWVMFDDLIRSPEEDTPSNEKGSATVEARLRFRFAPIEVDVDPDRLQVWSRASEDETGNLLIQSVGPENTTLEMGEGIAVWNEITQVPTASFQHDGNLPLAFSTILIPFAGSSPPATQLTELPIDSGVKTARATYAETEYGKLLVVVNDIEAVSSDDAPVVCTLASGQRVSVDAAVAVIHLQGAGGALRPTHVSGVDVRRIEWEQRKLVPTSAEPRNVDTAVQGPR